MLMVMMMDVIEMMVDNQADLVVHMEVDDVTKELENCFPTSGLLLQLTILSPNSTLIRLLGRKGAVR